MPKNQNHLGACAGGHSAGEDGVVTTTSAGVASFSNIVSYVTVDVASRGEVSSESVDRGSVGEIVVSEVCRPSSFKASQSEAGSSGSHGFLCSCR